MRNETHRVEENRQDRCERNKHPDTFVDRLQIFALLVCKLKKGSSLFSFFFRSFSSQIGREGPHTRCPRDVIMKLGQKQI